MIRFGSFRAIFKQASRIRQASFRRAHPWFAMPFAASCVFAGCGALAIPAIQGAGHESPLTGREITTQGYVTAVDRRGFYLQDEEGDGDSATSDAIVVFTENRPQVAVGERLEVQARVQEFVPGGTRTGNLSVTELTKPSIRRLGRLDALPPPVIIGPPGRMPPVSNIDDDGLASFDPADDAIDFFESLEAMRVRIEQPVTVSALNDYGELFVLPGRGKSATGRNARGGITIAAGDFNPERVQLQLDRELPGGLRRAPDVGVALGDIVGVVGYSFGNYEVRATEPFDIGPARLRREITRLEAAHGQLTIASFNVHNLGAHRGTAHDLPGRFAALARRIVSHLRSPDIVAVQEILDSDGTGDSGGVDAGATAARLIQELTAAGGPRYRYVDVAPRDGADGGVPGGNIRAGFLYNPARVSLVEGSLRRIEGVRQTGGNAFVASRKPLVAEFSFHDRRLIIVNVHLSSKRGSTPLFGRVRPPVDGNADRRTAQAAAIAAYLDGIAGTDAGIIVLGDFNDFDFSQPLQIIGASAGGLVNLLGTLPERERYTYIFEGNSQALDHVLVSPSLAANAELDVVHINAEFVDRVSDHDPILVRLHLPSP
ncbi:MAG: endonuclease/exonuclease/phosphatase family protein [Gammaproteobacteria bacterium]|nr:endonuclease/exonuclease/phosphatase family protein [Gammaproteobacteria bacterium]